MTTMAVFLISLMEALILGLAFVAGVAVGSAVMAFAALRAVRSAREAIEESIRCLGVSRARQRELAELLAETQIQQQQHQHKDGTNG